MEMAAALATLDRLESESVLLEIASRGALLAGELARIAEARSLPVTLSPYPQMPFMHFAPELAADQAQRRDRFYGALAQAGVFAHPCHHGFLCWRHTDGDMDQVVGAIELAASA